MEDVDFVILGPARSGSTLLCVTLEHHNKVNCNQEFFYKTKFLELQEEYKLNSDIKIYKKLVTEWRANSNKKPIVGFKFLFSNINTGTTNVYKYILQNINIKKILITRNILQQYISSRISYSLHSWSFPIKKLHGIKITFDKKDFLNFCKKMNQRYIDSLQTIQGELLTIDYKDICNTTAFDKIYNFLDIESVKTKLWTHEGESTKQNYNEMFYKVDNFHEMKDYILTTPYKDCLE